jgi:hypothetical protein
MKNMENLQSSFRSHEGFLLAQSQDGIRLSTCSLMLQPLALLAEEREPLLSSLFIHGFKLFASSSSSCASLSDQALIWPFMRFIGGSLWIFLLDLAEKHQDWHGVLEKQVGFLCFQGKDFPLGDKSWRFDFTFLKYWKIGKNKKGSSGFVE